MVRDKGQVRYITWYLLKVLYISCASYPTSLQQYQPHDIDSPVYLPYTLLIQQFAHIDARYSSCMEKLPHLHSSPGI